MQSLTDCEVEHIASIKMNFVDVHPLATCEAGGNGRTVVMVSNQTIPEDVVPVFQVFVQGIHRQDLDQFLVQPIKESWAATSAIRFSTPAQPNLGLISEDFSVILTAKDSSDKVCENKWEFQYSRHRRDNYCIFCAGILD